MTDLEMRKLCAQAMGLKPKVRDGHVWIAHKYSSRSFTGYNPLLNDEQAMALVKKFHLMIGFSDGWSAQKRDEDGDAVLRCGSFHQPDLNRAIVECVSRLQEPAY